MIKIGDKVKFKHWNDENWIIVGIVDYLYDLGKEKYAEVKPENSLSFRVNVNRLELQTNQL